jgi:hypothetical protein
MNGKVTLLGVGVIGGLLAFGAGTAMSMSRPAPRTSPPGKDQVAIMDAVCTDQPDQSTSFPFVSIRGTAGVGSTFLSGRITPQVPIQPTPTCAVVVAQLTAAAGANGCTVGPTAQLGDASGNQIGAHMVCSGEHDLVMAAIGAVARAYAATTLPPNDF